MITTLLINDIKKKEREVSCGHGANGGVSAMLAGGPMPEIINRVKNNN